MSTNGISVNSKPVLPCCFSLKVTYNFAEGQEKIK